VAHEGYKAYIKNQKILHPEKEAEKDKADGKDSVTLVKKDVTPGHVPAIEDYRAVMVQRAIFQSLASMGLPAFTIHSIVRYSGKYLKNAKNLTIRTYGPIGVSSSHQRFWKETNSDINSWVLPQYQHYHTSSTSRWNTSWTGLSIQLSRQ
jgi:hypothetical protein